MTNAQSKHQVKLDYTPLFKQLNKCKGNRLGMTFSELQISPSDAAALQICSGQGVGHLGSAGGGEIVQENIVEENIVDCAIANGMCYYYED